MRIQVKPIVDDCINSYEEHNDNPDIDTDTIEFVTFVLETYEDRRRIEVEDELTKLKRLVRDHVHADGEVVVQTGVFDS